MVAAEQRRDLPHDERAERAVLGAVLLRNEALARVRPLVEPVHFYVAANGLVLQAMLDLDEAQHPIDPLTVAAELRRRELLARLPQGELDLVEMLDEVPTAENVEHYARIVRDRAVRRELLAGTRLLDARARAGVPIGELTELLEQVRQTLPGDAAVSALATMPVAAVEEEGPVQWLVDELWAREAVGFVGGEPKAFKSFLTMHLAVCVASGKPALGRYRTAPGRVLCFNAEDRPAATRTRVARMCCALELEIAKLDLHLITTPRLRLDSAQDMARLGATIAREKPVLVILDPLRDLHSGDENDAGEMSALLSPLRALQREHGCSIMVVHHMAKHTPETNRRPGQRLRGSSALHGWIDSALYLARADGAETVSVTVEHRNCGGRPLDPFSFILREGSLPGGSGLWLELVEGQPAAAVPKPTSLEDERAAKVEEAKKRVIRVIEQRSKLNPLKTANEVSEVIRFARWAVLAAIRELERDGVVHRLSTGYALGSHGSGNQFRTPGSHGSPPPIGGEPEPEPWEGETPHRHDRETDRPDPGLNGHGKGDPEDPDGQGGGGPWHA